MGNVSELFIAGFQLLCAAVMGAVIGVERANRHQAAGLRTFSLVCLGSALAQMVDIHMVLQFGSGDPVRLAQGVINGIGFLGVGTIIVTRGNHIKGLTTAATLWTTAVLGICIGSGYVFGTIATFVLIFVIIRLLVYVSRYLERFNREIGLVLEVWNQEASQKLIKELRARGYQIKEMEKVQYPEYMYMHLEVDLGKKMDHNSVIESLYELDYVNYVQENR